MRHESRTRARADVWAGVAAVAAIPALYVLKGMNGGWIMFALVIVLGLPALLAWALTWVIAVQTFISRDNAFRHAGAGRRAHIAAWLYAGGFVVAGLVAPDGGDSPDPIPSALGALLGLPAGTQDALAAVTVPALAVGLLAFGWLVVEWVRALVLRAETRAGLADAPDANGSRRPVDVALGIALIAAPPLVGAAMLFNDDLEQLASLLVLWLSLATIATTSFLSRRNPFTIRAGTTVRSRAIGWAVIGLLILHPLLAIPSPHDGPLEPIAYLAVWAAWLLTVWLAVEWLAALAHRRRVPSAPAQ